MDKQALRRQIRERKRAMTEEDILRRSEALGRLFRQLDLYQNARTIYGYLPYNQEVRTVPMLEQALRDGKQVAVPKVYGDTMRFLYLTDLNAVSKGYAGIPEPIADEPVAHDETALVLMPGLAFDPQGHRMGYGGGFYDRFLGARARARETAGGNARRCPVVGFCFAFQIVETLPRAAWDQPVDGLCTEGELFWISR